jgi:hypothetical protein
MLQQSIAAMWVATPRHCFEPFKTAPPISQT